MATIKWLHLSDWHHGAEGVAGVENFDRQVILDALIADITDRRTIDRRLAEINFVVFSGDLSFSGKEGQFAAARTEFLDRILAAVQVDRSQLIIVPGNHDIDRDAIAGLPHNLRTPFQSEAAVQTALNDENRPELLRPFHAFAEFARDYTGAMRPDYADVHKVTVDGVRVALVGLNSSLMCGKHRDESGQVADYGFLIVGEPQVYEALQEASGADLTISVLHHPFDALTPFDRGRVEGRLVRDSDFVLHGDIHVPNVGYTSEAAGAYIVIPAGASHGERVPVHPRFTDGYNFAVIEKAEGTVFLRRYNDVSGTWGPDQLTIPGEGRFSFPLPRPLSGQVVRASTAPRDEESEPNFVAEAAEARARFGVALEREREHSGRWHAPWDLPEVFGLRETEWRLSSFDKRRFSRDQLLAALEEVTKDTALAFLKVWRTDEVIPLSDGYQDSIHAARQDWPYVYWEVRRSGFVYQASILPEDVRAMDLRLGRYLSSWATCVYAGRATKALSVWCGALALWDQEITLHLSISDTADRPIGDLSPDTHVICALDRLEYDLTCTGNEWHTRTVDLGVELAMELLQQAGVHHPPEDGVRRLVSENPPSLPEWPWT